MLWGNDRWGELVALGMLVNGTRARLVDMVNESCGDSGMNTAAAIHNDVLSEGDKLRVFLPRRTVELDGWTDRRLEAWRGPDTHAHAHARDVTRPLLPTSTVNREAW